MDGVKAYFSDVRLGMSDPQEPAFALQSGKAGFYGASNVRRVLARQRGNSPHTAIGRLLDEPQSSRKATAVFLLIIVAILTSIAYLYFSSVEEYTKDDNGYAIQMVEAACVYISTVERGRRRVEARRRRCRVVDSDTRVLIDG